MWCFGSMEENIRTRQGDDSIAVEFTFPPRPSPFEPGRTIDGIADPASVGSAEWSWRAPITSDTFRWRIHIQYRRSRVPLRPAGAAPRLTACPSGKP